MHDGFFGVLVITKGTAQLYNKSGKLLACPSITSSSINGVKNAILAGEICVFKDNKSTSHAEVAKAIANPEKQDLRFGVFDILEIEGNVAAHRIASDMLLGSVPLIVDTEYTLWFQHLLKEYVHYIPVKKDLSDLIDIKDDYYDINDEFEMEIDDNKFYK
jgi:hypothetical protein